MRSMTLQSRPFTLAVEDGWDSAHVLPKPGSQVLALCGKRPMIAWRRIWVEVASSHQALPACVRCVAVIETARDPGALQIPS
ncbi:MAG TPA: hypothetical protein VGB18_04125 [Candidatus Thermoplasmatota archaeon]